MPHNWAQNDLLTDYASNPNLERAVIKRTLDKFQEVVGRPPKAWLSSAIRGTPYTPAFLKEFGLIAYCDYLNDDQPYLIKTVHGPIVCVPYSNDLNDFNLFARGGLSASEGVATLKACFDQLYAEGAKTGRHHEFWIASSRYRPTAPHRRPARICRIRSISRGCLVSKP